MPARNLPNLTPDQVVRVQDALLFNADRLLSAALAVLEQEPGNVGLARSLAILAMEESGKAIAIHERRVAIAYAPEGESFVTEQLAELWASHTRKLEVVYRFLSAERYWFGTEAPWEREPTYLGTIKRWTGRHDKLKQRGFYVELDKTGDTLTPEGVSDEESLRDVISNVHQIGWQLRLGEHIEAKRQTEQEQGHPPAAEELIAYMRKVLKRMENDAFVERLVAGMREGTPGQPLNNEAYRLKLPEHGNDPFANMGKLGYEAETRELIRLAEELDVQQAETTADE